MALFGKYGVLSERELHSRFEILLENYKKTINIESLLTSNLARTMILPAALKFQRDLAETIGRTREALKIMNAQMSGAIVNMASVAGLVGILDRLAYATTKFAVVGLTKCMALDHAADGVRINCICPGRVETPWVSARVREYPDPEKAYREMAATQAMGRMEAGRDCCCCALSRERRGVVRHGIGVRDRRRVEGLVFDAVVDGWGIFGNLRCALAV